MLTTLPCHPNGPDPTCRVCAAAAADPAFHAVMAALPPPSAPARHARVNKPRPLPVVCLDLLAPTGETRPCKTCAGTVQVPLRACATHGVCTTDKVVTAADGAPVQCCLICRQRRLVPPAGGPAAAEYPTASAFEWVSTARLTADALLLAALLPADAAAVAGIPRSGMLPAAAIAMHLHLPLYELTEAGKLNRLGHGSRGRDLGLQEGAGPLVVVDDTVYGGHAMRKARAHLARLRRRAVFAAVYARPESAAVVDYHARPLPSPHLLEWNAFNNGPLVGHAANPVYGAGLATDLDGVLVHDDESGGRVGGPYMIPRTNAVPLIVTGRPEAHRAATEAMLRGYGARWSRLEMRPAGVPDTADGIAAFKAGHYAASRCGFFVESDPYQAAVIARLSGKPVVCPRHAEVFTATNRAGRVAEIRHTDRMSKVPARIRAGGVPANSAGGLLEFIAEAAGAAGRVGRVAEIGCYRGASTEAWAVHAAEVVAVDGWDAEWLSGHADRRPIRSADAEPEFLAVAARHPNVTAVRARSPGAADRFPDRHFDVVYVDGDHSYRGCLADLSAWAPKVKRGGWLAGHDYAPMFPGVVGAVNDFLGGPGRVFGDTTWAYRVPPHGGDGFVRFAPPLPVALPDPTSDRAVVTVSVGAAGRRMRDVSEPLFRAYAARLGADYVCVEGGAHPVYPAAAKWRLGDVVRRYDRTLFLDLDLTFDPKALPDLFDLCGPDEFGAFADGPAHRAMFKESFDALRASQWLPPVEFGDYFSTGVMVLGRGHAGLFTAPPHAVPAGRVAPWVGEFVPVEQNWVNCRVRDTGTRLAKLPRWANWYGGDAPPDWAGVVRHHAGLTPDAREAAMRAAVAELRLNGG